MHKSALDSFKLFKETYFKFMSDPHVVEIGSLIKNKRNLLTSDVLRSQFELEIQYTGIDIEDGPNVDLLLKDPYKIPIPDNSVDLVISVSTFEHTEFFWLTYLEILRILKPDGLFFLNVPSNGIYHRQPTDNWRFYPDSILALEKWAKKNNYNPKVLEHFTTDHFGREIWCDYVSVTIKDEKFVNKYPNRIINNLKKFRNGRTDNSNELINFTMIPQDLNHWGWGLYYKLRKILNKLDKSI